MDAPLVATAAPSPRCGSAHRDSAAKIASNAFRSPLQSGISTSTATPGVCARIASIVATNALAPPSSRSSRATAVTTACAMPMRRTASATRCGSPGSSATGWLVSTRQKPHARVHDVPLIMKVAVPSAQHSDRFGQPASSQTVVSPSSRIVWRSPRTLRSCFTCARSHSGLRASICKPSVTPACASRPVIRTGSPAPCPRLKSERSSGRSRHAMS